MIAEHYRNRGAASVEFAAGMMVLLPLLILLLFVMFEASRAYFIWHTLQQGAREAARLLATNYPAHPSEATTVADQNSYAFNLVHVNQVINSPQQFHAVFENDPYTGRPRAVTVTVVYASGQYGLPVFPDLDVLHLGSSFQLQGSARYTLE